MASPSTGSLRAIRFRVVLTIATVLAYLLSLSGYYVSPLDFWPGGLFALAFPYIWMVMAVLALWWWRYRRPVALVLLLCLVAAAAPLQVTFSIGNPGPFAEAKKAGHLRVMQWNCEGLRGNNKWWAPEKEQRFRAAAFIRKYAPDIICMEDYAQFYGPIFKSNDAFIRDSLGYPYHVFGMFSGNIEKYGVMKQGTLIASRIPFVRQGVAYYPTAYMPECIVWADIVHQGRLLRVIATHFSSVYLNGSQDFSRKIPNYLRSAQQEIVLSRNPFRKLAYYQQEHSIQAAFLRRFLDTSSVPVIFAGDLNTVPASHTYRMVRNGLTDGFVGSKTGMGATYNYLLPNLRIDYLLHSPALYCTQWRHFTDGFFDHDHLMGDYRWQ